jgi:hypothetical protein
MSGDNLNFQTSHARLRSGRAAAHFSTQPTTPGEEFSAWAKTIKLTCLKKYGFIAAARGDDKNLLQPNEAIQQYALWHQSPKTPNI